jgi:hypothetical protein
VFNDPRRRPDFLLWKRPAALPPLGDVEAHEGFIYMALSALCTDSDEEFKAIAALALLGDRQALPLLRLVADDPKGGEWADRVVRWDAQLADAEGVDLATWAEEPAPGDEDVSINVMFETAVDTGQAASVPLADAPAGAAEPPAGESSLYEERPESQEPPAELAEPPAGSTEAVPAATGLPETLVSPMEPPGLGRLDDAFDEFVERMKRSAGS